MTAARVMLVSSQSPRAKLYALVEGFVTIN